MPSKDELRSHLRANLDTTIARLNDALRAHDLDKLRPVLERIGRGQQLPHWYEELSADAAFTNLDGKTVGSIIEMLLVAVLETWTFSGIEAPQLRINPARGVDLPDLGLGVKSPSENYCTSEPFFSAYERLGADHDVLVLLTDYQDAKKLDALRLQIIKWKWLTTSQIADARLCKIAREHRPWLLEENEAWLRRLIRFLAFVNQSDWRAKKLLKLIEHMKSDTSILSQIQAARTDFDKTNRKLLKKDATPLPDSDLAAIEGIAEIRPLTLGVIDAAENWVIEVQKDSGRAPNDNEWSRFLSSPLDGQIGMSLALQWRYNFGPLFKEKKPRKTAPTTKKPSRD